MGSAGEGMARRANEGPCWCDVGGRRGRDHLGWVTWGTQGCGPQLGVILPTMGHLAMSEVILGGGNAAGISWAETKDIAKCPTVHGMLPPTTKNDPTQNDNSAKVASLTPRGMSLSRVPKGLPTAKVSRQALEESQGRK